MKNLSMTLPEENIFNYNVIRVQRKIYELMNLTNAMLAQSESDAGKRASRIEREKRLLNK